MTQLEGTYTYVHKGGGRSWLALSYPFEYRHEPDMLAESTIVSLCNGLSDHGRRAFCSGALQPQAFTKAVAAVSLVAVILRTSGTKSPKTAAKCCHNNNLFTKVIQENVPDMHWTGVITPGQCKVRFRSPPCATVTSRWPETCTVVGSVWAVSAA